MSKDQKNTRIKLIGRMLGCVVGIVLCCFGGLGLYRILVTQITAFSSDVEGANLLKETLNMHIGAIMFCELFVIIFLEKLVFDSYKLLK